MKVGQVYVHYKGGKYYLVGVAETHRHNGDRDAVYLGLSTGKLVTRPLTPDSRHEDAFTDWIEWPDGVRRARFFPLLEFLPGELERLERLQISKK